MEKIFLSPFRSIVFDAPITIWMRWEKRRERERRSIKVNIVLCSTSFCLIPPPTLMMMNRFHRKDEENVCWPTTINRKARYRYLPSDGKKGLIESSYRGARRHQSGAILTDRLVFSGQHRSNWPGWMRLDGFPLQCVTRSAFLHPLANDVLYDIIGLSINKIVVNRWTTLLLRCLEGVLTFPSRPLRQGRDGIMKEK